MLISIVDCSKNPGSDLGDEPSWSQAETPEHGRTWHRTVDAQETGSLHCWRNPNRSVRLIFLWSHVMEPRPKTFRELYCERFNCPPERFEQQLFWKTVYRRALPLARLIHWLHPKFFEKDLNALRQLGVTTGLREFQSELQDYRYHLHTYGHWAQKTLRVRISGQRLNRIARRLRPNGSQQEIHSG
jgi:hypothetical protein